MPKLKASASFAHEPDILHAIDDRFDELEETVALASMVPELHERLAALEQMVKRLSEQDGLIVASSVDPVGRAGSDMGNGKGPLIAMEPPPAPVIPPDDVDGAREEFAIVNSENVTKMGNDTPTSKKTLSSKKITDFSRRNQAVIDEKTLDTQTKEYYTFGESTWDLVLFIGTGALGPAGSFQTFLLAIINVVMQVVFCGIAYFNFISPDVNEESIEDALRWRRSSGHALAQYDSLSKLSLTERVCALDKSLHISGTQLAMYENIRKYLNPDATGLASFFTGQVLCIVALICWYLMVAKEVSHALALHRGVVAAERGPTRLDTRENPFTSATHYRLRTVGLRRKIASGFLLFYRLLAAGVLVFVGTFFLVYTVNVTELILNAVALGIILDIDDLLFDALATTPGRHLVHQLDPLPMPSLRRFRGADAKSVFMSVSIPALTIIVYFSMLEPMVGTLNAVAETMCGGNQGFVWDVDSRRVVLMSPTTGGGWADEKDSIKSTAITEAEQIGFGLSLNDTQFAVWVADVSFLESASLLQMEQITDLANRECADIGNSLPMLNYLRYFVGNQSIQSCADVAHLCGSITKMPEFGADGGVGFSVRMFCSETCQCRNPGGSQISVQGCPYGESLAQGRPCQSTPEFGEFLNQGVCIEKSAEVMRNNSDWASWVQTMRSYGMSNHSMQGQDTALLIADAMWDHGCGFVANLSAQNVSWGSCFEWSNSFEFEFKPVALFCPLTCGCSKQTQQESCPRPFGTYYCDTLQEDCLTYNDQHFCPYTSENIEVSFILYVADATNGVTYWNFLLGAVQAVVLEAAGHGLTRDMLSHYEAWPTYTRRLGASDHGGDPAPEVEGAPARSLQTASIQGSFTMWKVEASVDLVGAAASLFAVPLDNITSALTSTLISWGIPAADVTGMGLDMRVLENDNDDDGKGRGLSEKDLALRP